MATPWTDYVANMIGLDFETTGTDVSADRIVTASFITISPDTDPAVHEWLVNPGVDIPEATTAIHGVTTERAQAEGVHPREPVEAIVNGFVNAATFAQQPAGYPVPLVAFNAVFDLSLLHAEARRHGVEPFAPYPVIDPFVIDKAVDRYRRGKRNLAADAEVYGVRCDDAHQSTGDTLTALRLVCAMARIARTSLSDPAAVEARYADRKHPDELVRAWQRLARMSLDELHDAQVGWYAQQTESFAQYLRQQANEARHRAEQARERASMDGGDGGSWDEAVLEAEIAEIEAAKLDAQVDSLTPHWPITPLAGAS